MAPKVVGKGDELARMSPPWVVSSEVRGPVPNVAVLLVCQAGASLVAILLDALHFPDATAVITYVLGVLLTAMLTSGQAYSLIASVVSILSYNFFLISPRFSLQIEGRDYAATIMAMFLFALIASHLVSALRANYRMSMEASLVAQREQLRADLLRSVSHDLRTPLTAISGNADMLLDDEASLSAEARHALIQDIYDDATWLNNVVENLLGVTKLEKGDMRLHTAPELVDEVMEEAMRHVSRDASRHAISVEPPDELCLVKMDAQLIVQVIVNLVNNAITHTSDGSHITLSARREGSTVAVSVIDDGPGISDEDKAHVFESFYTSQGERTDSGRGVGLGLSLCKAIIEGHGGRIWVEDTQGGGATFTFTLPLEEVAGNG